VTLIGNQSFDSPFPFWFIISGRILNPSFDCQLYSDSRSMLWFTLFASICNLYFDSRSVFSFVCFDLIPSIHFDSYSWAPLTIFSLIHIIYFDSRSFLWFPILIFICDPPLVQSLDFDSRSLLSMTIITFMCNLYCQSHGGDSFKVLTLIRNRWFNSQSWHWFAVFAFVSSLCSHFLFLLSFTYFGFVHDFRFCGEWRPTLHGCVDWDRFGGRLGSSSSVEGPQRPKIAKRSEIALRERGTAR
jgi:hypothetical protein